MGLYDRIGQANPNGGANRFPDGEHIAQVITVKENKGFTGTYFIAECMAVQSTVLKPGDACSVSIRVDGQYPDSALGDVKAFITATMLGIDPYAPEHKARLEAEITGPVVSLLMAANQPARGHLFRIWVTTKPTKTAGRTFAKHKFAPIVGPDGRPVVQPLPDGALALHSREEQAPAGLAGMFPGMPGMPAGPAPSAAPPWGAPPAAQAPLPAAIPLPSAPMPGQTAPAATLPWGAAPAHAPPPPPVAFPPLGWTLHPTAPGYYYKGQECLTDPQLRARMAAGQA